MKKTLFLAMTIAMGITASAYAANPFSDVPAGHWAYDAVNKLAAEGVVEGYPDGTYGGDRLMTRYEMAQIVAKAMAKGANVDRLAAEFADELDSLGVRVANLEKKADNVRITGQIRYEYGDRNGDMQKTKGKVAQHRLRSRIFVNGNINEDWSYTGRFENNQSLKNSSGDDTLKFNQAYVSGRLGGVKVIAGKGDHYTGNGFVYDDTAEFIRATYGKDVQVSAYVGKPVTTASDYGYEKMWGGEVSGKIGRLTLAAGYDEFKDSKGSADAYSGGYVPAKKGDDNGIWNVSAKYKFDDFTLGATYLHSDVDVYIYNSPYNDVDTDGYVISANYKGADKNKPGSWGLFANYYDQGAGTFVAHTMYPGDWGYYMDEGFKGYMVGGGVTLAKNMVYQLHYYDLEGKESGLDDQVLWSRLQIMF
jgi:hypothetical protein